MGMTIKDKIMADTDNKELEERCEKCPNCGADMREVKE